MNYLILILGLTVLHCSSITTRVEINAPAEKVWAHLIKFEKYPEWNPFLRIEGTPVENGSLNVKFHREGDNWFSMSPTVLKYSAGHMIWRGRLLMPGIFTGEHQFRIEQLGPDRLIFHHSEEFNGLLIPFFGLSETEKKFVAMNEALKKLSESASRQPQ